MIKNKTLKIFFILGEESGDILGEKLLISLQKISPNIEFYGLAGKRMEKKSIKSIFPISELSLMGFLEIIPHVPKLIKRINYTAKKITEISPDIIISIDSPDFSFRVMKKIVQNQNLSHIKKCHLIAPSVWAYRENRAKKISKIYDLLLAILPFEPPFFEKYGLKTKFIGHPILQNKENYKKGQLRAKFKIRKNDKLISLTPGSRISEVKKILPEILKTAEILSKKYDNIKFAILTTEKTKKFIENYIKKYRIYFLIINQSDKYQLFTDSNLAIAKSGTNNIEMSLYQLPLIVTYKINFLSYILIKSLIKIRFANLINIIADKEIIPELLQYQCKAEILSKKAITFLEDHKLSAKQIKDSQESLIKMGLNFKDSPTDLAAKYILDNAI
jgi:lipid-A-disaccharide synthase